MPRKRVVSRTIFTTEAKVLCLDILTQTPYEKTVSIPAVFSTDQKLEEAVKKIIDTDTIKAVHVISHEVTEALYSMDESDFIKYAQKFPPRGSADNANIEN